MMGWGNDQYVGDLPLISGKRAISVVEFTRPTDTTAYAANDVISNSTSAPTVMQFTGMARANGGSGVIRRARMMTDNSAFVARVRWHIFNEAPTAIADNAQYTMLYANRDKRIGSLDFPAFATEGTGSDAAATMRPSSEGGWSVPELEYTCAANSTSLFVIVETLSAATPANAQKFYAQILADWLS